MYRIRRSKSIRLVRPINKFDTMNYHVLDSMEDLVRISSIEGRTIFENIAMKNAIKTGILRNRPELLDERLVTPLAEVEGSFSKGYKREVTFNEETFSIKISPVNDDEGRLLGYVEVFRNVTQDNYIKNELMRMSKKTFQDISLARNIQKAILPSINDFKNLHFQYCHEASEQLSGDIFDIIPIDDDRVGLYMADVVGHGISASIMTMFIRQTMRNILSRYKDMGPSETIMKLKKRFAGLKLEVSQYFTIIYMIVDTKKEEMTYVNAGHSARPIMFNDKQFAYLSNRGRFISNIFPDLEFEEISLKMKAGDRYLFYTDGVHETKNVHGEEFGDQAMKRWILKNRQLDNFVDELMKAINSYRWLEQKDDVTLLYMEIGEKND